MLEKNHPHEQGAAGGAHQDHRQGQGEVQQIEEGEHVLPDDLSLCLGLDAGISVVQALAHPGGHLLLAQAEAGVRLVAFHRPGPAGGLGPLSFPL